MDNVPAENIPKRPRLADEIAGTSHNRDNASVIEPAAIADSIASTKAIAGTSHNRDNAAVTEPAASTIASTNETAQGNSCKRCVHCNLELVCFFCGNDQDNLAQF